MEESAQVEKQMQLVVEEEDENGRDSSPNLDPSRPTFPFLERLKMGGEASEFFPGWGGSVCVGCGPKDKTSMAEETSVDTGFRKVLFSDGKGYVHLPSPIEVDEVELSEEGEGDIEMNGVVLSPQIVSCGGLFVFHETAFLDRLPESQVCLSLTRRCKAGGGGASEKEMADRA